VPLRRFLARLKGRGGRGATSFPAGRSKASRALELNQAISGLWEAEATHDRRAFEENIVPVYVALLSALKKVQQDTEAEATVIALLNNTTAACHYRWSLRLPLKRPGSDYRKYEIVYTYALITAMAVDCLLAHDGDDQTLPASAAARILTADGLARLQEDAMVWEDWLGFFEHSEIGGLYAAAIRDKQWAQQRPQAQAENVASEPGSEAAQPGPGTRMKQPAESKPAPGSGRAMLAALREGLQDGSLSFNQPRDAVQVDRDGRTFLEYPAAFEWCIERLALDADVKRVKNRFDRLKVYKRTSEGRQLFRGKLRQRDPRVRGYVLEDASVLWSDPPPVGRFVIENLTTLD
jgi:hypothetical protein